MTFIRSGSGVGRQSLDYPTQLRSNDTIQGFCISEVMTIVIAFHGSGFRTFKEFYTLQVLPHWRNAFPELVSYNRFVELMLWSLMGLLYFLNNCLFLSSQKAFARPEPQRALCPSSWCFLASNSRIYN